MESRKRSPHNKDGSIKKKLDKLADDIKKLPTERQDKLKDLMTKRAYSTRDAAAQLGISVSTLRRFLKAGVISHFRVGPRIRFSADEIKRFGNVVNLKEAADILGVHTLTISALLQAVNFRRIRLAVLIASPYLTLKRSWKAEHTRKRTRKNDKNKRKEN